MALSEVLSTVSVTHDETEDWRLEVSYSPPRPCKTLRSESDSDEDRLILVKGLQQANLI